MEVVKNKASRAVKYKISRKIAITHYEFPQFEKDNVMILIQLSNCQGSLSSRFCMVKNISRFLHLHGIKEKLEKPLGEISSISKNDE